MNRKIAYRLTLPIFGLFFSAHGYAENLTPSWKLPSKGTLAFIGQNGNHSDSAVVCKTISEFKKRENSLTGHPNGCVKIKSGTKAIIDGLLYDPDSVYANGFSMPIVKIYIPKNKMSGFVTLYKSVLPVIPKGYVFTTDNTKPMTFRLAKKQDELSGTGRKLGVATLRVIKQDAKIGDNGRDLYVSVVSNPAEDGWIFSKTLNIKGIGDIDNFKYAILRKNKKIPSGYLLNISPKNISGAIKSEIVGPFKVQRGDQDFDHFVDYYAKATFSAGLAVNCGFKGKEWVKHVLNGSLSLLQNRATYDYPLSKSLRANKIRMAKKQIRLSLTAGKGAPLSYCAELTHSNGYELAKSIDNFSK